MLTTGYRLLVKLFDEALLTIGLAQEVEREAHRHEARKHHRDLLEPLETTGLQLLVAATRGQVLGNLLLATGPQGRYAEEGEPGNAADDGERYHQARAHAVASTAAIAPMQDGPCG